MSAHLDEPVGLGDWTVRELVAHLGLGIGCSRYVAAAAPGAVPLSLGDYVRAYPPAADQIAGMTREIMATFGDDLVGGFRRTAAEAFAALDAIPGDVFQARRGPISRDDYLLDPAARAGRARRRPSARAGPHRRAAAAGGGQAVGDALAAAYAERGGHARDRTRSRVDPSGRRPGAQRRPAPAAALTVGVSPGAPRPTATGPAPAGRPGAGQHVGAAHVGQGDLVSADVGDAAQLVGGALAADARRRPGRRAARPAGCRTARTPRARGVRRAGGAARRRPPGAAGRSRSSAASRSASSTARLIRRLIRLLTMPSRSGGEPTSEW